ncbi:NADH-quinone oxidoreductase, E subunit [Hoeflea phototrophica DFL-43]|jgi:NADH-quinone oxidoreductase subunit E|uniref:NADH-quinone oxidoreductase, E subunit n=1 Tax=Hoeflea phototrophica (strain DSM 17068 / NCIMB 14078 / DFL-43) TaxID=411684 RepID=A9D644_HOEPD|nr:NADH-quinone oxidoreductase subunit E [Hoeflea phototrophica]EDQ33421.1 NADH-quinone oxidoreductase, E subunit [Hoeflea phototrophica DFL-43]
MSVRRLAEESVQPAEFAFNREFAAQAKTWIKKYPKERAQSAVIPLLMLAQEQDGWVTKPAIETIADMLGMPYIRALEVATFYTQFQLKPVGTRAHIQVCGTTPCMLRGSEELMEVCRSKIHPEPFHLNESGTLSWEEVECQGACVNAPMVMIFKDAYEDLTPERLAYIIDRFDAGRPEDINTGPQIKRTFSAPASGLTSLTEEIKPGSKRAAKSTKAKASTPAAKSPSNPKAVNSTAAVANTAKLVTSAKKPAAKTTVTKGNATMAVAATASGRAKAAADKTAAPKSAAAAKPSAASAAPSLEDKNRPAGIAKPANPEDLKMISGVGPKIEGILHSLGIYTFAQVASWKKAEREWVDGYLKFKGRIEREDWVKQAKALAKGGEAEYIKVFGKKPR